MTSVPTGMLLHYISDYDRDLEKRIWLEQKRKAVTQFWETVGLRLPYMRIAPIPLVWRNKYLRCDWCHPSEATRYQTTPQKLLLCAECAKRLKRQRYRRWQANKKWADQSMLYWSQYKYNKLQEQELQNTPQ